jgi:hypothetical protein
MGDLMRYSADPPIPPLPPFERGDRGEGGKSPLLRGI